MRPWAAATVLVLALVACRGDVAERGGPGDAPAGDAPAGRASAGAEVPAALLLIEGLDEEGGTVGSVIPADSGAAFFRGDTLYADVGRVARFLAPLVAVEVVDDRLRLDGRNTGIPVARRRDAAFVPLRLLAGRFDAYVRSEPEPGRFGTLWPADILCEYAAGADRRAEVFIEAAEQGLLDRCEPPIHVRVRRWADAGADETWAASVSFRERLPDEVVDSILDAHGAVPYGAYGWVTGGELIERVPADSASPGLLARLRRRTVEELTSRICGLPAALDRRGEGGDARRAAPGRPDDLHGERHLLASILAAREARERLGTGLPLVYGVDVVGPAGSLARIGDAPRVRRVDPATRVDEQWVVPGPAAAGLPGLAIPPAIERLDAAELDARLRAEAARAEAECPADSRPRRGRPPSTGDRLSELSGSAPGSLLPVDHRADHHGGVYRAVGGAPRPV